MNDRNYSFYLPDGTYEPMIDPENDMARLIYEHFGTEAEMCFKAILSNCWKKNWSVLKKVFWMFAGTHCLQSMRSERCYVVMFRILME